MSNLIDLHAQIKKLQMQADEIRAKEYESVVQELVSKMEAYGITLRDLQQRMEKRPIRKKAVVASKTVAKKRARASVPAKYLGPNGETWSGRGLMPRWLVGLVAEGRAKEEFAVSN